MRGMILSLLVGACLAALFGACREREQPSPPPPFDASRVRRMLQPPEGEVRAVPPHAIHDRGVGPYTLGASLRSILGLLPRGPRVMLMQIDGLVDYSLVRAEADTLLIGVENPSGVTFLSVLDGETARTDAGVGVGTTATDLGKALGVMVTGPDRAMDPRLLAFARLPNARFLLDQPGGRVVAVVVRQEESVLPGAGQGTGKEQVQGQEPARDREREAPGGAASAGLPCHAGGEPPTRAAVLAAAGLGADGAGAGAGVAVHPACFAAPAGDGLVSGAVVSAADQVALVGGDPGKPRRLAVHAAPGLVYAAPLDINGGDGDGGRSEIAVVSQRAGDEERVASLELLRFEAGRLHRLVARDVYRVSATNAAWVGARLDELDLVVELRAEAEAVVVKGLYVHRGATRPQTVVPLVRVEVPVGQGRKHPAPGAAAADAPTPAHPQASTNPPASVSPQASTKPPKPPSPPAPRPGAGASPAPADAAAPALVPADRAADTGTATSETSPAAE